MPRIVIRRIEVYIPGGLRRALATKKRKIHRIARLIRPTVQLFNQEPQKILHKWM